MNIQDPTGCIYSEWTWTPCVSNNKTGTRTVIHQPRGQYCDQLATVSFCGGTTTSGITPSVTPTTGTKSSQGKNFWIIIGIMIAIILILLGFVVF